MDAESLVFHLPIDPPTVTAQTKRAAVIPGHGVRFFPSKAVRQAEALLGKLLAQFRPPAAMTGPLEVRLTLVWPYRTSERAAVRREERIIPHTSRPDLDNLSKIYVDALVHGQFITDDGQIASLILTKAWGPPNRRGVYYQIRQIQPDEFGE